MKKVSLTTIVSIQKEECSNIVSLERTRFVTLFTELYTIYS